MVKIMKEWRKKPWDNMWLMSKRGKEARWQEA
jgi:hypothetical protein